MSKASSSSKNNDFKNFFLLLALTLLSYWPVWGRTLHGIFDWKKEEFFLKFYTEYIQTYKSIPSSFYVLPERIDYPTTYGSLLYFPNPEVITYTPFAVLALFLDGLSFYKALLLCHLLLAVWGTVRLARQFEWSIPTTVLLFCLICLNPWLMQHIAIGCTPWINALLVPLILSLLTESEGRFHRVVIASLFGALMLYQGGFHVFVWFSMGLAFFALCYSLHNPKYSLNVLFYFILTAFFAAPKLLSSSRVYGAWRREILPSYDSLWDVYGLLTDATVDLFTLPAAYNIYGTNVYDGSCVMGHAWLALLVVCLLSWFRATGLPSPQKTTLRLCLISGCLFTVLGWDGLWAQVCRLVPILSAEVYPFRFLFIAIVFFSLAIIIWLEAIFRYQRPMVRFVLASLMLLACLSTFERNVYFSNVATSDAEREYKLQLSKYFKRNLRAIDSNQGSIPPRVASDGSLVYETKERGTLELTWLRTDQVNHYEVQGGHLEVRGDYVYLYYSGPVKLLPRRMLGSVEVVAFLLLNLGLFSVLLLPYLYPRLYSVPK